MSADLSGLPPLDLDALEVIAQQTRQVEGAVLTRLAWADYDNAFEPLAVLRLIGLAREALSNRKDGSSPKDNHLKAEGL